MSLIMWLNVLLFFVTFAFASEDLLACKEDYQMVTHNVMNITDQETYRLHVIDYLCKYKLCDNCILPVLADGDGLSVTERSPANLITLHIIFQRYRFTDIDLEERTAFMAIVIRDVLQVADQLLAANFVLDQIWMSHFAATSDQLDLSPTAPTQLKLFRFDQVHHIGFGTLNFIPDSKLMTSQRSYFMLQLSWFFGTCCNMLHIPIESADTHQFLSKVSSTKTIDHLFQQPYLKDRFGTIPSAQKFRKKRLPSFMYNGMTIFVMSLMHEDAMVDHSSSESSIGFMSDSSSESDIGPSVERMRQETLMDVEYQKMVSGIEKLYDTYIAYDATENHSIFESDSADLQEIEKALTVFTGSDGYNQYSGNETDRLSSSSILASFNVDPPERVHDCKSEVETKSSKPIPDPVGALHPIDPEVQIEKEPVDGHSAKRTKTTIDLDSNLISGSTSPTSCLSNVNTDVDFEKEIHYSSRSSSIQPSIPIKLAAAASHTIPDAKINSSTYVFQRSTVHLFLTLIILAVILLLGTLVLVIQRLLIRKANCYEESSDTEQQEIDSSES